MADNKVFSILEKAGWYVGRSVDISTTLEYMTNENLPIFSAVDIFLKEFCCLKFYFSLDNSDNYIGFSFIVEHGVKTLNDIDNDLLGDYKKALKCNELTIIGSYSSYMTLLIDDNSNIYAVEDNYIQSFGHGLDGVFNIIKGKGVQVPTPDWW